MRTCGPGTKATVLLDWISGFVFADRPPPGPFTGPIVLEDRGLAATPRTRPPVGYRLHDQADRPNILVKIPGTPPGLTAMELLVADGIGINVTLLFSDSHYLQTADA